MKKIILISVFLCFGAEGILPVVEAPRNLPQNRATVSASTENTEMQDVELNRLLSSLEQLALSESSQDTSANAKNKVLSGCDLWLSKTKLISPFQMISMEGNSGALVHPVDSKGAGKTKAQVGALLFGPPQNMNTRGAYPKNRKTQNKIVMMGCQRQKRGSGYFKKK